MSLLTNTAALSALQSLSVTQQALATTQSQMASGLRVQTASDSSAYWSIAMMTRSQRSALSAQSDALASEASILSVAAVAVGAILNAVGRIRADLVTAQQPGAARASVQSDIAAQQRSIAAVAGAASYNGVNLVAPTSAAPVVFTTSLSSGADGTTSLGTSTLTTTNYVAIDGHTYAAFGLGGWYGLLGAVKFNSLTPSVNGTLQYDPNALASSFRPASMLSFDITNATTQDLSVLQSAVDQVIPAISDYGSRIAAIQTTISNQQSYVSALSDALAAGTGALVDADMNVASTRLQALQTQQQLGIQALSTANGDSRLNLKLFGG